MVHLSLLTSKQQELIHNSALNILKTVGCAIHDKRWLKILAEAGAKVDFKNLRVFIVDEDLVNTSIASCGRKIRKLARDPKNDILVGDGFPEAHTPEGATHVIDLLTRERRLAQLSDLRELVKICDALYNVDSIVCPIVPNDVPPALQTVITTKTLLENSLKPITPSGATLNKNLPYILQMKELIAGDRDITDFSIGMGIFTTSPLTFHVDQLDLMWQCTDKGLTFSVGSAPQAGSTAPASLAGMLSQFTAEVLMGLVMCQVKNPGLNQYIYIRTYLINPRFGSVNCSNPEVGLVQAAATQLFKEKYLLPVDAGWAVSDSHSIDLQTAFEKSYIWSLAMMAGVDMISGVSGLSGGLTSSGLQAVIDDEIISYLRRACSGIIVDSFHLGAKMIHDIGIGGTFLTHPETGKIIRKEQWLPDLSNHETYEVWNMGGSLELIEKANKKIHEILKTHKVEPLDTEIQNKLDRIAKEATQKLL